MCHALWSVKEWDNSAVCCCMLGHIIRDDEGSKERKEQTAQIHQALNPVFHLTARNSGVTAHPGRCHGFSFHWSLPKHVGDCIVDGHRQGGSKDKDPPTAEHNSQSWRAEHLSHISAAPWTALWVAQHIGSLWEAQWGWGNTVPCTMLQHQQCVTGMWQMCQHMEKQMQWKNNTSLATLCFRARRARCEHWRWLQTPACPKASPLPAYPRCSHAPPGPRCWGCLRHFAPRCHLRC